MKMSWRRWKLGLLVAILTGFFTGLAYLSTIDTASLAVLIKFSLVTLGVIGKDAVLFLQNHPVDEVEVDGDRPLTTNPAPQATLKPQ
jgi:hypothetical protein